MKKTASLIFLILCMIAFSSTAFSSETESKLQVFGGKIVSIDLEHKTFTLKEDTKGNFTCTFTDRTKVLSNNRQMTISDMKVGNIAVVVYAEASGKNLAKTINFFAPAKGSP
jgi:hypothetical protein